MNKRNNSSKRIKTETNNDKFIVTVAAYQNWFIIISLITPITIIFGIELIIDGTIRFKEFIPLLLVLPLAVLLVLWFIYGEAKIEFNTKSVLYSKIIFGFGMKKIFEKDKIYNFRLDTRSKKNNFRKSIFFNHEFKEYSFGFDLNKKAATDLIEKLNSMTNNEAYEKHKIEVKVRKRKMIDDFLKGSNTSKINREKFMYSNRKQDTNITKKQSLEELVKEYIELKSGVKPLELIKYIKEESNLGLKEAKEFVEMYLKNNGISKLQTNKNQDTNITKKQSLEELVKEYIRLKNGAKPLKLELIKYIKEGSNLGLKEAKEFVEIYLKNNNVSKNQTNKKESWIERY